MRLRYKIWFEKDREAVLTELKYKILKKIKEKGSIKEASRELGISYKKTLEHIKAMEKRLGYRVVERRRGRGARLTPEALSLLELFERAVCAFEEARKSLEEEKGV
ncbi:MAG: LysR family transcriptional regulator [Aquificae bacterium]|nr:LysR family transcriptional regulator [Aquificota bacterium]